MRKAIAILTMTVAALAAAVFSVTPAMAAGPELTCTFSPGNGRFLPNLCENGVPAFSYTLTWLVQNGTSGTTYSWTHPGIAVGGCTSTSDECQITVGRAGRTYTATVVVTQGSTHTTLSESAEAEPVCANDGGPVFC